MRDAGTPATAVINAGGRSQRMAASGIAIHKALVPVLGVPLVERNLCVLLDQGFRDIVIVVSAATPDVEAFVRGRLAILASARGANVECIREVEPLGNMGAARQIATRSADLLVTFVDNLTALHLADLVTQHRQSGASLTIATHTEAFQIPHGELVIADGVVNDYIEKPTKDTRVASGVYALRSDAAAFIPQNRATGAVDLFHLLKDRGEKIAAFEHHAPWIDVNDAAAVRRADNMVADNADMFERGRRPPDVTDRCVLIRSASRILAADRSIDAGDFRGRWDLARARGSAELGRPVQEIIDGVAGKRGATFDDFADANGDCVRHEVRIYDVGKLDWSRAPDGFAWIALDGSHDRLELTQPLRRCIAIADHLS
jgi:NDP-sugar pyrophosphorylase family protein